MSERFVDRRRGQAGGLHQRARRGNRLPLQRVVDDQRRLRRSSQTDNAVAIGIHQLQERVGSRHSLRRAGLDSLGEEVEPPFPIAAGPNGVEQLVVERTVALEEEARIEHRLPKRAVRDQLQDDEKPADAAVPVEKRMDGLELHMAQRRFDERRHGLGVVVEEPLEVF